MIDFPGLDPNEDFHSHAERHGVEPAMLAALEALASQPVAVDALKAWLNEWSEQYRVAAVQSSGGNEWLEKVGGWKALQQFSDVLSVRLNDYASLQNGYRDAQARRLRHH